ncbi:MAG: tRNA-2-methylthio-N6-dimethylallyladenosine synthase, partial [Pseudonocardiales bacterium]|nr:tRNA-2-methylthio-N6-dimethylallyladenosine synthase [Pseudonocardiales bacterium]
TPAATLADQVPKAVVTQRYQRLVAVQEEISWELNRELVGRTVELLVAQGEGRKDAATSRLSGRARDGRLVHFAPGAAVGAAAVRPGDVVEATITYAAPHHLVADGPLVAHRRTRAGDLYGRPGAAPAAGAGANVTGLGLPGIGRPGALSMQSSVGGTR